MRGKQKKTAAAILIFDIVIGLLLLVLGGNKLCGSSLWQSGFAESVGSRPEMKGVDGREPEEPQEHIKIALTFDDGPHPYYTEQLLDGLKERGVAATFFVTGEHAALHPDVIERMQEEGHLIGNHTYSHMQLNKGNRKRFKAELLATNKLLEEIIGEEIIYVRPPYGTWDKSLEKELNMIPVLWTIDPLDWCSDDVACVVTNVTEKVGENDIILLHDYYESTVTAALKIVDELEAEGYVFVTVEEILFD